MKYVVILDSDNLFNELHDKAILAFHYQQALKTIQRELCYAYC